LILNPLCSLFIYLNVKSDLRDLQQFPYLEELICDNNSLSEETKFPVIKSLKLFSCNKNNVNDIHLFIDRIKVSFPNLTYLSMLGNKACPNQLVDENNDEYDYYRYRKYVLYRLKNLRFLDSYEVKPEERELIDKETNFYDVITYKDDDNKQNGRDDTNSDSRFNYTPLVTENSQQSDDDNKEKNPKGNFLTVTLQYNIHKIK
jgi:leucine-rich melanocyte differentiation-associated protein